MAAKKTDGRKPAGKKQVVDVPAVAVAPAKPLKPAQCRSYMRRRLAEEFPGIVDGFVKEAKAGNCAHVKLASELLEKPATTRRGKSSAEKVLEKWGRGKRLGNRD